MAMTIGQLARASGVSAGTVRYYEKQGLLPSAQRTDNGYRCYGPEMVQHVRFIKSAQSLGFSLAEIRGTVLAAQTGQFDRRQIEQRLQDKMRETEHMIRELQARQQLLQQALSLLTCPLEKPLALVQAILPAASLVPAMTKATVD